MAAEAFIRDEKTDVLASTGQLLINALVTGNNHASKFTASEAAKFADHWQVLDQRANTNTGFSGTLFQCIKDDPTTGAKAGELTVSFRSTEFVDDAVRDNLATNTDEIKNTGWAWGQISDMEDWYDKLKKDPKLLGDKPFSVTGYSLGGHLATAFNLLHPDSALQQVVTFNGAGVGKITSGTLQDALKTFNDLRRDYTKIEDRFTDPNLAAKYTDIRSHLADNSWTIEDALRSLQPVPLDQPISDDANKVISALKEIKELKDQVARVAALKAGGTGPDANQGPKAVSDALIAAEDIDYRMAVKFAAEKTASANLVLGVIQAYGQKEDYLGKGNVKPNQFDVVGDTSPSAVSNSQWHLGTDIRIFIEDQPLFRGGILKSVVDASLDYGSIQLLVDGYAKKNFGDTHSLVLLVDSLNLHTRGQSRFFAELN